MQNTYLKTFEQLFFNIDDNEKIKNSIEQSSYLLDAVITKYGEVINEISVGTSKQDDFVDTVIMLFARKIMEQLDAINILFASTSFEQAQVILRSMIENIVSLEFILKEHTKKRAAAYYLEHHYQEIERGNVQFDVNTVSGKLLFDSIGGEEFEKVRQQMDKKEKDMKQLIKSKEVFTEVDKARKKKLKDKGNGKQKVYIQWYEVCSNVRNIKGLLKATGYEKYYDAIYGVLSFETHGLNATMGMKFDETGAELQLIRNPEGGGSTLDLTCSFAMGALYKIYQYLHDGECEKEESRKFFEDFVEKRKIASKKLDMIRSSSCTAQEGIKNE